MGWDTLGAYLTSFDELIRRRPEHYFCGPRQTKLKPAWYWTIPRFDLDDLHTFVQKLGLHHWTPESISFEYKYYRLRYIALRWAIRFAGLFMSIYYGILISDQFDIDINAWMDRRPRMEQVVIGTAIGCAVVPIALLLQVRGNRSRFWRLIYLAASSARGHPSNSARSVNLAGRAARSLFRTIQGGRWTWAAPPSVSDRALTLVYPIIDLDLTKAGNIHLYGRFLHDVAALVMLGEVASIPKLRSMYELMPERDRPDPDVVPERDALYLDPMRNHHRWAVIKDFLFPLSSWLSVFIALVALVVSLAK